MCGGGGGEGARESEGEGGGEREGVRESKGEGGERERVAGSTDEEERVG